MENIREKTKNMSTYEIWELGEEMQYKADCYLMEHKEEYEKLSRVERMKKLAEVMLED